MYTAEEESGGEERRLESGVGESRVKGVKGGGKGQRGRTVQPPRDTLLKVEGNRLFGRVDMSRLVGEDEIEIRGEGEETLGEIIMDSQPERKQKGMDWKDGVRAGTRVGMEIEERREGMKDERTDEMRILQGIMNKSMLTDGQGEVELQIVDEESSGVSPVDMYRRLKVAAPPTVMVRDRSDLVRVLHGKVREKKGTVTEEEIQRLGVETELGDDENKENRDDRDTQRGGMGIEQMIALEEGEGGEENRGSQGSEANSEINEAIKGLEAELADSDDRDYSPGKDEGYSREGEDDNEGSFADGEAEEGSESVENSQSGRGGAASIQNEEDDDGEEAVEDGGESKGEVKVLRRLKRVGAVREERRRKRAKERVERAEKREEREKERKRVLRDGEIFDDEADLGEIVNGEDGAVKAIDKRRADENDDDEDSSRDLDGLVAEIDEIEAAGAEEDQAFAEHVREMVSRDRELLKRIVKGHFRQSIMDKTEADREREQRMKAKRLEAIKKELQLLRNFTKITRSKEDNFKKLLGVDEEELEGELEVLERQIVGENKPKAADRKEDTAEKEKKKAVLGRLNMLGTVQNQNAGGRRQFLDSDLSKNSQLMDVVKTFDVEKKPSTSGNQIFMFRKKQPGENAQNK